MIQIVDSKNESEIDLKKQIENKVDHIGMVLNENEKALETDQQMQTIEFRHSL